MKGTDYKKKLDGTTYCKICKMIVMPIFHVHSTPDPIPTDADWWTEDDIFVFGSNDLGHHDGGAAKAAMKYYGAIYGQARGLQGQSYAIVTISFKNDPNINIHSINNEVKKFLEFAKDHPDKRFWMTKIGTGISNIKLSLIREIFISKKIPNNVILPKEFKVF